MLKFLAICITKLILLPALFFLGGCGIGPTIGSIKANAVLAQSEDAPATHQATYDSNSPTTPPSPIPSSSTDSSRSDSASDSAMSATSTSVSVELEDSGLVVDYVKGSSNTTDLTLSFDLYSNGVTQATATRATGQVYYDSSKATLSVINQQLKGRWILFDSGGNIFKFNEASPSSQASLGVIPLGITNLSNRVSKIIKSDSGQYLLFDSNSQSISSQTYISDSGNSKGWSAASSFSDTALTTSDLTATNISYAGGRFWLTATDESNSNQTVFFLTQNLSGSTWNLLGRSTSSSTPQYSASGVLQFHSLWLLGDLQSLDADSPISYSPISYSTEESSFSDFDIVLPSTSYSIRSMVSSDPGTNSLVLASSNSTLSSIYEDTILRSSDGKTWTDLDLSGTESNLTWTDADSSVTKTSWPSGLQPGAMTYDGTYFYVVVSDAPYLLRSRDGRNWTSYGNTGISGPVQLNYLYAYKNSSGSITLILNDSVGLKVSNDGRNFESLMNSISPQDPSAQWVSAFPDEVLTQQY